MRLILLRRRNSCEEDVTCATLLALVGNSHLVKAHESLFQQAANAVRLDAEILVAYERELSKRSAFDGVSQKDRAKSVLAPLIQAVVEEVLSHYDSAGVEAPWLSSVVKKRAEKLVRPWVMKTPYLPTFQ